MKNVQIDPKINTDPEYRAAVERANQLLDGELGRSSQLVSASWSLTHDSLTRPVVQLEISDWTGRVTASFAPDELKQERHLQHRLIRLWGDLLQIRSHAQLDDILATATQAGAEGN